VFKNIGLEHIRYCLCIRLNYFACMPKHTVRQAERCLRLAAAVHRIWPSNSHILSCLNMIIRTGRSINNASPCIEYNIQMYINNPKSLTHKCTVRMASHKYHVRHNHTIWIYIDLLTHMFTMINMLVAGGQ